MRNPQYDVKVIRKPELSAASKQTYDSTEFVTNPIENIISIKILEP